MVNYTICGKIVDKEVRGMGKCGLFVEDELFNILFLEFTDSKILVKRVQSSSGTLPFYLRFLYLKDLKRISERAIKDFEVSQEGRSNSIQIDFSNITDFKIRKSLEPVWDWERVLVVSEFLPRSRWTAHRAMQRNKTIIGLSEAMILIEAGRNGGSMHAGRKALQMHRKLYAPVYEGMPDSAIGNRILLEEGALPLLKSKMTGTANLKNLFSALSNVENNRPTSHRQQVLL